MDASPDLPLACRIDGLDALDAAERLSDLPHLTFLDSALRHATLGRFSYVAADPFGTFVVEEGVASWNGGLLPGEPLAALEACLAAYPQPALAGLPPFQGGAAGFLAYELGAVIEGRPGAPPEPAACPQAVLPFYDVVIAFDHEAEAAWLVSTGWPASSPTRRDRARRRADEMLARLARPLREPPPPAAALPLAWTSNFTRSGYVAAVEHVIGRILAGDIFQANISQRFTAALPATFEPWRLYRRLREANPAPFAAFLGYGDLAVASSSPERFLQLDEAGRVETRPIKGTARRSQDPAEDRRLAAALLASEKDRAENVMIVDLLRNDLSRVCRPGSVQVPALCELESYASVHHLVSVVEGRLEAGRTGVDLVRACFPGGSVTGAPKIKAMEIITDTEGRPRDVYCGAIGFLGFDGRLDLNIAIRTALLRPGRAAVQAGGGVTALSDPEAEYDETLAKARRLLAAFGTEGWDP